MQPSVLGIKSKAYLIIVGAFIIGVVTGSLLMNLVVAKSLPAQKPSLLEELTRELQLTTEQKSKVDEIYKDSRQRGKDIGKVIQPQLDELRLQTRAKVKTILAPQQQQQFENWCAQREVERKRKEESK